MSLKQARSGVWRNVLKHRRWPIVLALLAGQAIADRGVFSSALDVTEPLLLATAATAPVRFGQAQPIRLCSQVYSPNTNYDPRSLASFNVLTPQDWAIYAILKLRRNPVTGNPTEEFLKKHHSMLNGALLTVVTPPAHGKLLPVNVEDSSGSSSGYFYMADQGYFGRDSIKFKITYGNGTTVAVIQDLNVIDLPTADAPDAPCATKPAEYRKLRAQDFEESKKLWKELKLP